MGEVGSLTQPGLGSPSGPGCPRGRPRALPLGAGCVLAAHPGSGALCSLGGCVRTKGKLPCPLGEARMRASASPRGSALENLLPAAACVGREHAMGQAERGCEGWAGRIRGTEGRALWKRKMSHNDPERSCCSMWTPVARA